MMEKLENKDVVVKKARNGRGVFAKRKFSPDEIVKLQSSEWGRKGLEQALTGKTELLAKIKEATGKDILNSKGKLAEWFGSSPVKMILIILAIILGVGAVAMLAAKH